jgi:hypothetical protein
MKSTASLAEVEEDLEFQLRSWRVQRLGWLCFGLIILGSLLGLGGEGPLAERSRDAGRFALSYTSPMALGRQSEMLIRVQDTQTSSIEKGPITLWLRGDLEKFQGITFFPQPLLLETRESSMKATFEHEVRRIVAQFIPQHLGAAQIELTLAEARSEAAIWILP